MVLPNKSKLVLSVLFSLILVLSFALSVTALHRWEGNVTIGTNTTDTSGAIVGAYSGSSLLDTRIVGSGIGSPLNGYVITLNCSAGSTISLKVWGITANTTSCPITASRETINLSVPLITSTTEACTYSSACASNYRCCSGTAEVNDGTTSGATCKATCAAATPAADTSSGGSSGGGGGGGGTALGSETSTAVSVTGSSTTSLSFAKSETLAVTNVELSTTSTAAVVNGKVAVKETTVGESMSSGIASGSTKVYKYLSITKQNIKDSDLSKAKITFEVPVSWINANNIDLDSVKLNRYVDSQWVALPTTRVKALNSRGYLYEAETPGFSTFAISGKASEKLTAFQLIDIIRDFYAGKSAYTAFDVIDKIRAFYA